MKPGPVERVCVIPRVSGIGGMVTFQNKFLRELEKRNIPYTQDLDNTPYSSVLVIGGTRQWYKLARARDHKIPVVQRLDGMNWMHKLDGNRLKKPGKIKHFRLERTN